MLPWPRAYNQLNVQPDTVLFSTARTKEREPLFKWACPIARSPIVLIALKESRIRLSSLQDASRYRIAAILDDLTSSPTFALRVSGGGFPLLGDSCSRSTWFLLHRAA